MAKTYKSNFKISQLDKVANGILSEWILANGADTVGTVEALRTMQIGKVQGFDKFTEAESQRQYEMLAKAFSKKGYVAGAMLGKAMAKYDPHKLYREGASRGDAENLTEEERIEHINAVSPYAQNADVVLNALDNVHVDEKKLGFRNREDFRTYEDFTKGLERALDAMKKGGSSFDAQEAWGLIAAAGYAREVHDENIAKFNLLKSYQKTAQSPTNVYDRMWNALGIDQATVQSVLSGNNVPNSVLVENSKGFADNPESFDVTDKDIGRITLSGIKTYGRMADQLSSLAVKGVLVSKLGLNETAIPVGTDQYGATIMQEYKAFNFATLERPENKPIRDALSPLVLREGETQLSDVDARLTVVAQIVNNVTEDVILGLVDDNGVLQTSRLSEQVRVYLESQDSDNNPLFATNEAKVNYVREVLLTRTLEAAVSSGAANLNDKADILLRIAEATSTPENELMFVPEFNEDGTPKEYTTGGPGQRHTQASLFAQDAPGSQNILFYNGQSLVYDGEMPDVLLPQENEDKMSSKDLARLSEERQEAFAGIVAELQGKYEKTITDLDLSGAKLENFRTCDPLTTSYSINAGIAQIEKKIDEEKSLDGIPPRPFVDPTLMPTTPNPTNPTPEGKPSKEGPVLFRDLTLYRQYLAEFKQLLENSGLKFVNSIPDNSHITGPAQGGNQPEDVQKGDEGQQGPGIVGQPEEIAGTQPAPAVVPSTQEIKDQRAGIRNQVETGSKIYMKDGEACHGKFAMVRAELADILGVEASAITPQDMMAAVAKIRGSEGTVKEAIAAYKNEFNSGLAHLDKQTAPEDYLTQFSRQTQLKLIGNQGAGAVMQEIGRFAVEYTEQFLEEDYQYVLEAQQGVVGPDKAAEIKGMVEEDLNNQACEFAAAEELAVLLNVNNHDIDVDQVPQVELPKIPTLEQSAGAVPEAGVEMVQS